jgi:hypothetical protein
MDSERFMIEAQPPASSKLSSFTPSNREAPLVEKQRQMLLIPSIRQSAEEGPGTA